MAFAGTRRVFWALSACPEFRWGSIQRSPDPLACCPLTEKLFPALGLSPQISRLPSRQISG